MTNLLVISHRGNMMGPRMGTENKKETIIDVITRFKIPVEVDVRILNNKFYLGHDTIVEEIDPQFLIQNRHMLYVHAKTPETASFLKEKQWPLNWFFHDKDSLTVTSKGDLWCFPGIYLPNGITVELGKKNAIPAVYGVCTDHPLSWIGTS